MLSKITGIVKRNLGRGRHLGFPTANLEVVQADLEDGVYYGLTAWQGKDMPSLVFIGHPETFNEHDRKAEVYILDFIGDLYDQQLSVQLIKKARDSVKFINAEELIEQMEQDEQMARGFFDEYFAGKDKK